MEKDCGCKSIRTCLLCENGSQEQNGLGTVKGIQRWEFCLHCETAWRGNGVHPNHNGPGMPFPGITVIPNFITEEEEKKLVEQIDTGQWCVSQSGRKKQDFGPKVNFKKKKVKFANFTGLPEYSKFVYERMLEHNSLKDFVPVELCNLEYVPERGSAIDPHFDDFWLWGERLVTLNMLSDTILSMTKDGLNDIEVAVSMPARCLIVVYGPARYEWKHAVLRHDIKDRRLATTLRELTPEFLSGGKSEQLGKELIDLALTFNGKPVAS